MKLKTSKEIVKFFQQAGIREFVFYTARDNRVVIINELDGAYLFHEIRSMREKRFVVLLGEL